MILVQVDDLIWALVRSSKLTCFPMFLGGDEKEHTVADTQRGCSSTPVVAVTQPLLSSLHMFLCLLPGLMQFCYQLLLIAAKIQLALAQRCR